MCIRDRSGSLVDGNYQLTIDGGEVIDSQGSAMDVDGDGTPGGILIIGDEEEEALYRLFGDVDQNRTVNVIDLLAFRIAFLSVEGDPSFNASVDWNLDGVIDVRDLLAFRRNFLKTLPFDDGNSSRSKFELDGGKLESSGGKLESSGGKLQQK